MADGERNDPGKRTFTPPSYIPGMKSKGPSNPTKEERDVCGYAPKGYNCNTTKAGPCSNLHTIYCGECPHHPMARILRRP